MTKVPFGRTHLSVSRLGFGGAPIGLLAAEQQQATAILNHLLDQGVNLIDTAAMYAGSEEMIGRAVSHRRDQFVLVSKCGHAIDGISAPAWSAPLIAQSVDRSLRNLQTDHLDAMLLHSCDLATLNKGEAIGALVDAQRAGKVRFVGYSGDNAAAAWAAACPEIAVLEMSISICDQANIGLVLPVARQHNVATIAKRPLANAAWKDLAEQPGFYQNYVKPYNDRLGKMGLRPADVGFAGPLHQVWPELALRFVLSQGGLHTAIIGTTNLQNARTNLGYAEKGPLPPEVVMKFREAFDRAEAESGAIWTGLT